jgi:hypothetical protein
MKFRNIRVKKAGGGYRTQRAMVLASGKLKFVKNTGRTSARKGSAHVAKKRRSHSKAVTHRRRSHSAVRHRRRGRGRGGRINLMHLAIAGAGLAYLTGASGPAFVKTNLAKVPGTKTFGPVMTGGIACLAIDRFVKPNKWLRLAGAVGVVAGAMKLGDQGANFKWLGDDDMMDIGDDDMGDDDMGDDDMGDDDVGDDE